MSSTELRALVTGASSGIGAAFARALPPFDSQRIATLRSMIDVNVTALVELTHAALPGMRARRRGRFINVASTAAFQPVPYLTVYAATKAFVLSFSEGRAEELRGSGVRVQALCPGITATEFLDVAETHRGLLVTRMPMLSADDVVQALFAGSMPDAREWSLASRTGSWASSCNGSRHGAPPAAWQRGCIVRYLRVGRRKAAGDARPYETSFVPAIIPRSCRAPARSASASAWDTGRKGSRHGGGPKIVC